MLGNFRENGLALASIFEMTSEAFYWAALLTVRISTTARRGQKSKAPTMGKKGKKSKAGKVSKGDRKRAIADLKRRLEALAERVEDELKDVDLFAPPPPSDDCDICFVALRSSTEWELCNCCGKMICRACSWKQEKISKAAGEETVYVCPFCRGPRPKTGRETVQKLEALAAKDHPQAMINLGEQYCKDSDGIQKDELKAVQFFLRAAELGSPHALLHVSRVFQEGGTSGCGFSFMREMTEDTHQKSDLFCEFAAKKGELSARYNLGVDAMYDGEFDVAKQHWLAGAWAGHQGCLKAVKAMFLKGLASKHDYDQSIRRQHQSLALENTEEREEWLVEKKRRGLVTQMGNPNIEELIGDSVARHCT